MNENVDKALLSHSTNSSSHIAYTQSFRPFLLSHQVASYSAKFPALVMQITIAGMNIIFFADSGHDVWSMNAKRSKPGMESC